MTTHDSPTRLTVAQWREWAEICRRDGRDDLVLICLNEAAMRASEDGRTLAEMLLDGGEPWTS